ncbi:helix-turn-helix transcriptional regulator [Paramaledivibacter caminithermalis]|jgi:DNA-binding NarL/FixJ family response regulator|uniref:Regulatory protein, luxR family n=1 Tax=Paramaledivibacter caminithermalis (strain DSM 15212 / CIP 107654 / DViRD3) TaxID=1121301 RepID=A0A1M6TWF4_PARC5|nr:hypothetical protein [Paramaledivibacter caminithermalis]SHK61269.1 regulatory protein, luxR family [Paramaledivibacter caminithermalis DSM 15212]
MTETAKEFGTWMDMKISCKESKRSLNKSIEKLESKNEKTIYDIVDLDIEREMRRDVAEAQKIIEQKLLYEFNTLSEEDIRNARLTEKEVLVARLRQSKTIREIAGELGCFVNNIFEIYKSALKKIERYRRLKDTEKILSNLSPQQRTIYKLLKQNKSNNEIAKELCTTSANIRKQKSIINKKIKCYQNTCTNNYGRGASKIN